ncbi:hypothetical protein KY326_01660 [Candidatus Woesearchaeota archaeon]|nr:hypothetical protein [Candidatus Woesearchaeota archaeon]
MNEKNMVEVFERQSQLVERLKQANMDELLDVIEELAAINPLVKTHISTLKKFVASVDVDKYNYNKQQEKYEKV